MKIYLGTMNYRTVESAYDAIKEAHGLGYYGIDSAKVYGNEEIIGEALKMLRAEGIEIKVQTKISPDDLEIVNEEFKRMLSRLQLDKVDSLLLHRPSLCFKNDLKAWRDLIDLKAKGIVKHIGVSNYEKDLLQILIGETGVAPEMNQIEMSPSFFRHDRLKDNNDRNIEIQGWSPMGKNPARLVKTPEILNLSNKYSITPGQVMVSFLTSQGIVPIIGTSKLERIEENLKTVKLTKQDIESLAPLNIYENKYEVAFPHRHMDK